MHFIFCFHERLFYFEMSVSNVRVQVRTRTDSTRSYDSHSSSTVGSDPVGVNKPLPPPVALKPPVPRHGLPAEERGPAEDDPTNTSFLGKVGEVTRPTEIQTHLLNL